MTFSMGLISRKPRELSTIELVSRLSYPNQSPLESIVSSWTFCASVLANGGSVHSLIGFCCFTYRGIYATIEHLLTSVTEV